jgi:hypothetical protein
LSAEVETEAAMKRITVTIVAGAALALVSLCSPFVRPARAQDTAGASGTAHGKQEQGILKVGEITIVGRVQKPIAAVDVAKIQPKLTLAELRQPFLDRIEEAVHKDPF